MPAWRMTGFLMKDKARFAERGLLPGDLPPFAHGYSRGRNLWLYEQPSDYYRRHLLLHEGTHGFMNTILGGCGPPWYMEGMAELLGTHRWRGRPADARLHAAQPRGSARVGPHAHHSRRRRRASGEVVEGGHRILAHRPPRDRALCLVLGGRHVVGPPSALPAAVPSTHPRRAADRLQRAIQPPVCRRLAAVERRVATDGGQHGVRLRRVPQRYRRQK